MLRITVKEARPAMILARAVQDPRSSENLLLDRGIALTPQIIARLHEAGVYDLWVQCPGMDFLEEQYSAKMPLPQQRLHEALKLGLYQLTQRSDAKFGATKYMQVFGGLLGTLFGPMAHQPVMNDLAAMDDWLLRHSANVCCLGLLLGLKLEPYIAEQRARMVGRDSKEVANLGLGCLLHDLGEIRLSQGERESHLLADHPGEQWKQHAELGYGLVRGQIDASAAAVALHHHQHFDGTGFPLVSGKNRGQMGREIHVFSRLAMVADTFEYLLCRDGMPMPVVYALWQLQREPYRNWCDPVILQMLLRLVPPFMPGMVVVLSDERSAVVVRNHESAPCYPVVQVLEAMAEGEDGWEGAREEVDLAATSEVSIARIDGFMVEPYLYGERKVAELVPA